MHGPWTNDRLVDSTTSLGTRISWGVTYMASSNLHSLPLSTNCSYLWILRWRRRGKNWSTPLASSWFLTKLNLGEPFSAGIRTVLRNYSASQSNGVKLRFRAHVEWCCSPRDLFWPKNIVWLLSWILDWPWKLVRFRCRVCRLYPRFGSTYPSLCDVPNRFRPLVTKCLLKAWSATSLHGYNTRAWRRGLRAWRGSFAGNHAEWVVCISDRGDGGLFSAGTISWSSDQGGVSWICSARRLTTLFPVSVIRGRSASLWYFCCLTYYVQHPGCKLVYEGAKCSIPWYSGGQSESFEERLAIHFQCWQISCFLEKELQRCPNSRHFLSRYRLHQSRIRIEKRLTRDSQSNCQYSCLTIRE